MCCFTTGFVCCGVALMSRECTMGASSIGVLSLAPGLNVLHVVVV